MPIEEIALKVFGGILVLVSAFIIFSVLGDKKK